MAWTIEVEARAERDLEIAYVHAFRAALSLGESDSSAARAARKRIEKTIAAADRLARAPFVGTLHSDIAPGLRHVTLDRAIFWFTSDDATQTVRIVGIFHGGQDHLGRMLSRLTGEGEAG